MKQFGYLRRITLLAALFAALAATTAFPQEARVSIPSSKSCA
jgi:ABC-type sugar transport system substrate-binding protein